MAYIMLSNLQVVLPFVYLIVKCFKKVFMYCFTIKSIVIYHTTIIPNTLNKVANCVELKVVKDWSIKLEVDWPVVLKYYLYIFQSIQYILYIAKHFVIMRDILNQHYRIENCSSILNELWDIINQ